MRFYSSSLMVAADTKSLGCRAQQIMSSISFGETIQPIICGKSYTHTLAEAKIEVDARRKWITKHWLRFLLPIWWAGLFLSKYLTSLSLWISQRLSSAMQVKQMLHFESYPTNLSPDPRRHSWMDEQRQRSIVHVCLSALQQQERQVFWYFWEVLSR